MKIRQIMLIGAVLCVVCFAIGCSSSGSKSSTPPPPPPPPPAVTISISPDKAAVTTGGVTTLQVTLTNDTAVTWTVNDVANGDARITDLHVVAGLPSLDDEVAHLGCACG